LPSPSFLEGLAPQIVHVFCNFFPLAASTTASVKCEGAYNLLPRFFLRAPPVFLGKFIEMSSSPTFPDSPDISWFQWIDPLGRWPLFPVRVLYPWPRRSCAQSPPFFFSPTLGFSLHAREHSCPLALPSSAQVRMSVCFLRFPFPGKSRSCSPVNSPFFLYDPSHSFLHAILRVRRTHFHIFPLALNQSVPVDLLYRDFFPSPFFSYATSNITGRKSDVLTTFPLPRFSHACSTPGRTTEDVCFSFFFLFSL